MKNKLISHCYTHACTHIDVYAGVCKKGSTPALQWQHGICAEILRQQKADINQERGVEESGETERY